MTATTFELNDIFGCQSHIHDQARNFRFGLTEREPSGKKGERC